MLWPSLFSAMLNVSASLRCNTPPQPANYRGGKTWVESRNGVYFLTRSSLLSLLSSLATDLPAAVSEYAVAQPVLRDAQRLRVSALQYTASACQLSAEEARRR